MNKLYKAIIEIKGIGVIGERKVRNKAGRLLEHEVTKVYRKYLREKLNINKPRFINTSIPDKDEDPQAYKDYKDGWHRIATIYSDLDVRGREHLIRWEVTPLEVAVTQENLLEDKLKQVLDEETELSTEHKKDAMKAILDILNHLIHITPDKDDKGDID